MRHALGVLGIVLALPLAVAGGCAPAPPCPDASAPTTVAYRSLPGVDPDLLSLDVHRPKATTCGAPVVVWVHGGGFVTGDKGNGMADKARLFNGRGWILVSVNYRLSVPGDPNRARYPDHYRDVAAALKWVDGNIARYGGDRSRVALLGHSAGADIVANLTAVPSHLASLGLGPGTIDCAGPLDTDGFDKVRATEGDGETIWSNALGNEPEYRTVTSATLVLTRASGAPPTITAVRGTATRRSIQTAYLAKLSSLGVETAAIDARGLTHEQVNSSIGAPGDTVVTPALTYFLAACFRA